MGMGAGAGVGMSAEDGGAMVAGKTYAFHLSFTNPLYDPIQIRLKKAQTMLVLPAEGEAASAGGARRAPFVVTLPTAAFAVAAFAEAWEYEDEEEEEEDEDMFGIDEDEMDVDEFDVGGRGRGGRSMRGGSAAGRNKTVGVLERRANVTVIGGEVMLTKEAKGRVKVRSACLIVLNFWLILCLFGQFNMLVSYTYRSDDAEPSEENELGAGTAATSASRTQPTQAQAQSQASNKPPEMKNFSFYTVVDLGEIVPRAEVESGVMDTF